MDTTTPESTGTTPVSGDLFRKAAEHASQALPTELGAWLHHQFIATADTVTGPFGPYADAIHIASMAAMAWEVLTLPIRPGVQDPRVQAVAKALWEQDFPPTSHMSWAEINQKDTSYVARYLQLAQAAIAALVVDEAEHERLFPAILRSLTTWLVDHHVGLVDEADSEEGVPEVHYDEKTVVRLAADLLLTGPGIRPVTAVPSGETHG